MSFFSRTLAALCLLVAAGVAQAEIVTLDGTNLTISYDPSNFSMAPSLTSSGVNFSASELSTQAGGSSPYGTNQVSSSVSFVVSLTNASQIFSSIDLESHGAYTLSGPQSSVSLTGSTISVSAVSDPSLSVTSNLTPLSPLNDADGSQHYWTANGLTSLSSALWSGVRSVQVTIFDDLTASASSAGSSASIAAGFLGLGPQPDTITIGLSTVPLPDTLALMGVGLACLWGWSRRSRPG